MTKIRVAAVSYLNTKPLLYGIFTSAVDKEIELSLHVPAVCAEKLVNDEVDLALMPVAALRDMPDLRVVSDYCIGTDGPVRTVCIYSDVPMEEMEVLYLDNQSRTSVILARYLMDNYWKKSVEIRQGYEGFQDLIGGRVAGLVIGDKALDQELRSTYVYDLGNAWKELTGLPFVFAVWATKRELPESFVSAFNEAMQKGIDDIDRLVMLMANTRVHFNLQQYYRENISFALDHKKRIALERFLEICPADALIEK